MLQYVKYGKKLSIEKSNKNYKQMRKANMNNNQIYPFERNRYYPGKMLTSADFQAEQNYFNNKRRFLNNMMYGA